MAHDGRSITNMERVERCLIQLIGMTAICMVDRHDATIVLETSSRPIRMPSSKC